MVLLDAGVLVVRVQARGDPTGDDPGAEPAGGGTSFPGLDTAAEDQADLVRAAAPRLSRMTCSKNTRPDTGLSSIWVRENSACRIEMS